MSAGRGINPASYKKHDLIAQLAAMQTARACTFLGHCDRVAIIDMHAGDAKGAKGRQPDFWRGDESRATALIACDMAAKFRKRGIVCDMLLFERSHAARDALAAQLAAQAKIHIGRNHRALLTWPGLCDYTFAVVLNDPNGPSDHGDEILAHVSRQIPRADSIIVVNEGFLVRLKGVGAVQTEKFAGDVYRARDQYLWRFDATEWARRLGRRYVLRSKITVGANAMKGRILLVTNAPPERTPRNFTPHAAGAGIDRGGPAFGASRQSAPFGTNRRDRGDRRAPLLGL